MDKTKDIKFLLDDLFGSIIEKIDFNTFNNTISLTLKIIENGKETIHNLEFKGVWSHYYIKDTSSSGIDFTETNYLELISIDFSPNGISSIECRSNSDEWFNSIASKANFALEIWEGLLLIEARYILIDNYEFELTCLN